MFRRLTHFFFGEDEETPTNPGTVKSGEIVDDEWLLVPHQELVKNTFHPEASSDVSTVEDKAAELVNSSVYGPPSNQGINEDSDPHIETRMSQPELSVQRNSNPSRVLRGFVSQVGALAKVTQMARIQRAQALSDRHLLGRTGTQRQNCVRQRAQRRSSRTCSPYLQQPGHRNSSH